MKKRFLSLNIDENLSGIKATTNEKLGPEGRRRNKLPFCSNTSENEI